MLLSLFNPQKSKRSDLVKLETQLADTIKVFNETKNEFRTHLLLDIINLCKTCQSIIPFSTFNHNDPIESKEFVEKYPNTTFINRCHKEAIKILFALSQPQAGSDLEKSIFEKFSKFNIACVIDHKMAKEIIELCNVYLTSIPITERYGLYLRDAHYMSSFRKKYPNVEIISELQKEMVKILFLPELPAAKSFAQSRWKLIQNLVNPKTGSGKMLAEENWIEFRYQGKIAIANWVDTISSGNLLSFEELLKSSSTLNRVDQKNVYYISETQKNDYLVQFKNYTCYKADKKDDMEMIDTRKMQLRGRTSNYAIYVATKQNLYIFHANEKDFAERIHHSSILSGRPVLCAGTIEIVNGKIVTITNDSGHYVPGKKELIKLLERLSQNKQIDLSKISITLHEGSNKVTENAKVFLDSEKSRVTLKPK